MEPLRVECRLQTPMAESGHPLHLDALLAWARVDEADGDIAVNDDLPLERFEPEGGDWVWRASVMAGVVLWRQQVPFVRSYQAWVWAEDHGRTYVSGRNTFPMGTGPYKGYDMRRGMVQIDRLAAYCVGDPTAIRRLLGRVTNLGGLRRWDAGRVGEWSVTPDPEALTLWERRVMPVPLPGYRRAMQTLRPPYWDRARHSEAWVPPQLSERCGDAGEP
jgi:CRISPR type IV-associated protein Csf3